MKRLRQAVAFWAGALYAYILSLLAYDHRWFWWPHTLLLAAGLHGCACWALGYRRGYGDAVAQQWDELRYECDVDWGELDLDDRDRH